MCAFRETVLISFISFIYESGRYGEAEVLWQCQAMSRAALISCHFNDITPAI